MRLTGAPPNGYTLHTVIRRTQFCFNAYALARAATSAISHAPHQLRGASSACVANRCWPPSPRCTTPPVSTPGVSPRNFLNHPSQFRRRLRARPHDLYRTGKKLEVLYYTTKQTIYKRLGVCTSGIILKDASTATLRWTNGLTSSRLF